MRPIIAILLIPLLLIPSFALPEPSAPYRGQQQRTIKALSNSEIEGLQNGAGLGLALAAELNHYPGPRHVLELAQALQLSELQSRQIRAIYQQMKAEAIEQGTKLIEAEAALDQLFANGEASDQQVDQLLTGIGRLSAQLRGTHLKAHLALKPLLSEQQIARYDELRGYTAAIDSSPHHQGNRHAAEHHRH
ncbi:Spy/CpxP family protein refolding chaperone [Motiliproteus sediminis]|uniref:Spy/CpxP family protein refolding chaperone n=1 Tax=Motiliproteus sediminis TaxID=1468178 RepID=UPI001AEFF227|nr:hypothetical protein [Motiliproteus sediminis]